MDGRKYSYILKDRGIHIEIKNGILFEFSP